MAMNVILTDYDRAACGFSPQERIERLATISAERKNWALMFLSGYAPAVFDAVLDQVEPGDERSTDGRQESEPYCARCGQEIEPVPVLALGWQHAADGDTTVVRLGAAAGDHEPAVAWRPASPLPW
jgi:hypothetical protein